MSDFDIAIPTILTHEGLTFTNDPDDHGGATKFGLTLSFLNENVDHNFTYEQLENMDEQTATGIYKEFWWDKYGYEKIGNQDIATKVFDTAVNIGPARAYRLLQRACCDSHIPVDIDGHLGPQTLAALPKNPVLILKNLKNALAEYYKHIVYVNPDQEKFLKGWLNRAYS